MLSKLPSPRPALPSRISIEDEFIRSRLSGLFEEFVNNEATMNSEIPSVVMKVVNQVASRIGSTAWAGSQMKGTDIPFYSDADIWIETRGGNPVSNLDRLELTTEMIELLKMEGFSADNISLRLKPIATTLEIGIFSADIVFSNGEWIHNPDYVRSPFDAKKEEGFFLQPHRQRAVRALKLLSKYVIIVFFL
jgi:hypothetical protein